MTLTTITITPTIAWSAFLGLGTGLGLLLIVRGWRAPEPVRPSPWRRAWARHIGPVHGDRHRLVRIGLAVAVAVLTGLVTGWLVGAVLAGVAVWALPRLLGRDREY